MASAGTEVPGFVSPPPRLNATDGNLGFASGRDQDRRIEDVILLGTDKFHALKEQDSDVTLVLNRQVGNRSCLGDFLHRDRPAADALIGKQVLAESLPVFGKVGPSRAMPWMTGSVPRTSDLKPQCNCAGRHSVQQCVR